MKERVYIGTELKYNIHLKPIEGQTMDDFDFEAEFSSGKKVLKIPKTEMKRVDSNNYKVMVDTALLGVGELKLVVNAYIPDVDFSDGLRREVLMLNPNTLIINPV